MKTQTKARTLLHTFSKLHGLYLNKNTSLGQAVGCQGEKNVWQACRCMQTQPGGCTLYHLCIYTTYSYSLNFFQIYHVMLSNVNESLWSLTFLQTSPQHDTPTSMSHCGNGALVSCYTVFCKFSFKLNLSVDCLLSS